jgi:putative oxidoreductase
LKNKDLALLLLRIVLFAVFMYHGFPKAVFWEFSMQKFIKFGFPGFLGPVIGILEVIFPLMLLIGFKNKESNILLALMIIVAILGVQLPKAIEKATFTAGLERDLLILAGHYLLICFGPGSLALKKGNQEAS